MVDNIKIPFIVVILSCLIGRAYLLADSFQESLLIDKVAFCCIILFLMSHILNESKNIVEKIAWMIPIIWISLVIYWNMKLKLNPDYNIIDRINQWGAIKYRSISFNESILSGFLWLFFMPAVSILFYFILNRIDKILNIKSDEFNENDIFILLATPSNRLIDLVWCIFTALPVSSVWALSKGYDSYGQSHIYTYYFKRLGFFKGVIKRRKVVNGVIPLKNYIRLNTGISSNQKQNELKKRLGTPWSLRNALCYFIFLNSIGGKSIFKMIKERI